MTAECAAEHLETSFFMGTGPRVRVNAWAPKARVT